MDNVKEFGEVHESATGSKRYNSGKPEFHHLSPKFIKEMMELMTKSAEKYGDLNWALGQELSTPLDSMMRHYLEFAMGENNDQESGKSHLLHIALNAMIAWYSVENYPELDDRFLKRLEKLRK